MRKRVAFYVVELPGKYFFSHPFGPSFKPAHRPSVKGGRWQIRKMARNGRWRAWTSGVASQWNASFYSYQLAFSWATVVARAYADKSINSLFQEQFLAETLKTYRRLDRALQSR